MKALVIGYGSIGQRHARILRSIELDVFVVSKRPNDEFYIYNNLEEALLKDSFDYIVIANETIMHFKTLSTILAKGYSNKILVEKPLFMKNEIISSATNNVFVAYNLRFHPLITALKEMLIDEKIISVNAYVGQYLPTWRPTTDYSKGYSASSQQGGGVLRDLSHELDYLMLLFGEWQSLSGKMAKISDLNIDSEDYVQIFYETRKKVQVAVELNYLDRIIQRYITIQTNNKTIKVDFINNFINCNGEITKLEMINRDYTYQKQHESVLNNTSICCTFEEGLRVMKMIEAVENSSQLKEWVYNV